jgi:ribosomal protein L37AE/L43A
VTVLDIACPDCGETENVEKEAVDRYRCRECGGRFTHEDVLTS